MLHLKTLKPSRGGIGRRLNNAKKALKYARVVRASNEMEEREEWKRYAIIMENRDMKMFVSGPDMAIIPLTFLNLSLLIK